MKEKLTKNLGMKLLSIPLAAIIWYVIINIDNPISTKNISNIPTEIVNESYITASGQVYDIVEGANVTVTVKAKRSIRDKIKASDIRVTANLAEITQFNRVELTAECTRFSSENIELTVKPKMMTLTLENRSSATQPVQITTTGVVDSGYYVDSVKASPNMIEISGAESTIEKINEVRVSVDVSGHQKNFKTKGLVPRVYDKKGREIDSSRLDFSHSQIEVKTVILPTKMVPIQLETEGNPAVGYTVAGIEYGPEQIELAGKPEVLAKVYSIPIKIDVSAVSADLEKDIELADYVPEGTKLVGDLSSIAAHVKIEKLATRDILLRGEDIRTVNLSEDLTMHYSLESFSVTVTLIGEEDELKDLKASDLNAYIDLEEMDIGSHTAAIQFELPPGIQISGSPMASIVIEEKEPENSPEPGGEEEESPKPDPGEEPDAEPEELEEGEPAEETGF